MAQPVSAVAQRNRYSQPYDFDALFSGADWRCIGSVSLRIIAMTQLIRVILGVINFSQLRGFSWFNPSNLFLFNDQAALAALQNTQPVVTKPVDFLVRRLAASRRLDTNEIRLGAVKFSKAVSRLVNHQISFVSLRGQPSTRTSVIGRRAYRGWHAMRFWLSYGLGGTAARAVNLAPHGRSLSAFDTTRKTYSVVSSDVGFAGGLSFDFLTKRSARRFFLRKVVSNVFSADRHVYRPIDSRRFFTTTSDENMLFAKNRAYRKLRKIIPLSFMRTKSFSRPSMWVKKLGVRLSKRLGIGSAINNYNNRSLLRGDLDSVLANSARNIQQLRTIETYFGPIVLIGMRVKSRRRFS